jgi:hypothetical protein
MRTFQVETYDDCQDEIGRLLQVHYDEVAMDKAVVPLSKNDAAYRTMADTGQLHILTCREDGILVGYIVGLLRLGLHNATTLMAYTDVYFLRPDLRHGGLGIKLFREYERTLIQRGVIKVFIASKVHLDMSKIFERLGWTRTEVVYTKVIQHHIDPIVKQIDLELADWRT